jgi:hypothetical protein
MYSLRRSGGEAADHRLADANRTLLPGERRPGKWAVLGPSRKAHLPFRPQARTTSCRTKEWAASPLGRGGAFLKAYGLARLHSHCRRAGPTVESVRLKAPRLACRASCVDRPLIFRPPPARACPPGVRPPLQPAPPPPSARTTTAERRCRGGIRHRRLKPGTFAAATSSADCSNSAKLRLESEFVHPTGAEPPQPRCEKVLEESVSRWRQGGGIRLGGPREDDAVVSHHGPAGTPPRFHRGAASRRPSCGRRARAARAGSLVSLPAGCSARDVLAEIQ